MRLVRSVRSMIFVAALVSAMAIGAASASAFSLSSSTATSQAGAPTDMLFTYAATGSQSVSRLDVDLPPGMMHDPSSTTACPLATFQADRCPATSRVGSVGSTIVVGLAQVSVPGEIFRVADSADDSDLPLGIVLRPPLSALGLTGKIFLRDRVSFTNGGGLRHTIPVTSFGVSVLGIPLRARIGRMSFSFTGRNTSGNQLHNSTSCATTHFRASAVFSDGSPEVRESAYSTTGCNRLIFSGGLDFTFDDSGPQKTSFALLLRAPNKSAPGVTHEYHRVGGKLDVTAFGEWDDAALVTGPACTASDIATNTCPDRAKLGRVSVGIEGFPGTRTGAIFNSFPRGAKPRGVIRLNSGAVALFTVDLVNGTGGRTSIDVDGLPQLPLTDIGIDIDAPLFMPNGKPASCSNREARGVILGHNGGQTNTTAKYPPVACPPEASFADPSDADADGDGLADKPIRPENFDVWYEVADGGNGIDESSVTCSVQPTDAARPGRGKVKDIRNTGGNPRSGCEVTEAAGDITVVFSVASVDGHVTVLKSAYNVDSEAPVLSSIAPDPVVSSSTILELPFEFTDDLLGNPHGDYEMECVIEDASGARHTTTPGHKYIDKLTLRGGGRCQWDTGKSGRFKLEVVVRDSGGHVTVLKRSAVVDAEGPVIELVDPSDQDSDGDGLADDALRSGEFIVAFTANDDMGLGDGDVQCSVAQTNPAFKENVAVGHMPDRDDVLFCPVRPPNPGDVELEITATSVAGHVTVLKMSYTVDSEPPVIDAPGEFAFDSSGFEIEFSFTDDTARHPQSKFKAGAEIEIKTGYLTSEARIVTDRDSGRSKGFARFENVPDGTHEVTLRVRDKVGHVTLIKRTIKVDSQGPLITVLGDLDANGDGTFDKHFLPGNFKSPFRLSDDSPINPASISCAVPDRDWQVTVADLDRDGIGDACEVAAPTPGPFELEISAADVHGHVTVLKLHGEIDPPMEPPVLFAPAEGQSYVSGSTLVTDFTITGEGPFTFECRINSIVLSDNCVSGMSFNLSGVATGDYTFTVTARDEHGNSALASSNIRVISPPAPGIALTDPSSQDANHDGIADNPWRPSDFGVPFSLSGVDPSTGAKISCTAWFTNPLPASRVSAADLDNDGLADVCNVESASAGAMELSITVEIDGHVTVLKIGFTIDTSPPSVAITTPAADGALFQTRKPTFVVRVTDDHRDKTVYEVTPIADPTNVVSTGDITYQFTNYSFDVRHELPDGEYRVKIIHRDLAARTVTATRTFTVHADIDPKITINVPSQGEKVYRPSPVRVGFRVDGDAPFAVRCLIDSVVVSAACTSGMTFSSSSLALGSHVLTIEATDEFGRVGSKSVDFQIGTSDGGIVCIAIYPPPEGCPGYIPPGGGGVITFP